MFYTSPEAYIPTPKHLCSDGSKIWRWIEFGPNKPVFLVTQQISEGDLEREQSLMFAHIQDLMAHAVQISDNVKILKIAMLSPGCMNGTKSYQLGRIKQVSMSRQRAPKFLFEMSNGQYYQFPPSEETPNPSEFEMLMAF